MNYCENKNESWPPSSPQDILLPKRKEKQTNKNSYHPSYTAEKATFPAKSAESVLSTEDTSWIIHVWFSCVKKRVGAQELWHQGKH